MHLYNPSLCTHKASAPTSNLLSFTTDLPCILIEALSSGGCGFINYVEFVNAIKLCGLVRSEHGAVV